MANQMVYRMPQNLRNWPMEWLAMLVRASYASVHHWWHQIFEIRACTVRTRRL